MVYFVNRWAAVVCRWTSVNVEQIREKERPVLLYNRDAKHYITTLRAYVPRKRPTSVHKMADIIIHFFLSSLKAFVRLVFSLLFQNSSWSFSFLIFILDSNVTKCCPLEIASNENKQNKKRFPYSFSLFIQSLKLQFISKDQCFPL